MDLRRLLKHLIATHWQTRRLFPSTTLDAIERAVAAAEESHGGEICFAIETSMPLVSIWNDVPTRRHAHAVFAHLGVWDTQNNNGVLIYVQRADRKVEIVADRGFKNLVSDSEWAGVCRLMEGHFRAGRFKDGAIAGVEAAANLIARHFPSTDGDKNELPNRPALL